MITPSFGLTESFKSVLKTNYCNFEGRARSEFWIFTIVNYIILFFYYFLSIFLMRGSGKYPILEVMYEIIFSYIFFILLYLQ